MSFKFIPFILFALLLVFAGIAAITQEAETEAEIIPGDLLQEDTLPLEPLPGDELAELLPIWIPPAEPRWFRSNAGGMTLEEIPSRLAALRNQYALVIDYVPPEELEPRLLPYWHDDFSIEIRVLYENGTESRRQWLLRDEQDIVRVNAVFKQKPDEPPPEETNSEDFIIEETPIMEETLTIDENNIEEAMIEESVVDENVIAEVDTDETVMETPSPALVGEDAESIGFIEVFNDKAQIIEDHWLYDNEGELVINYFYNRNTLVKSETKKRNSGDTSGEYIALYADSFRYNRSYSLRSVERLFLAPSENEPVRLTFPNRVLEAAASDDFLTDKLSVTSDFLGNYTVSEGFRIVYDTDSRGRILTQTMIDDSDEVLWSIINTWSGDRIIATLKTEGEDKKLTEYEYDDAGNRIVQRDINNGVLERQVRTEGKTEIEELYLNGILALRAYWEDGRKISEERVRRR